MVSLAQAVGIVAMILSALSFQMNTKKKIIIMQILTSIVFATHYFMLGNALAAAVVNLIAIVRNVVMYYKEKLPLGSKFWVVFFCIVMAASAVVTNPEPISLLMSVGMIFNTLAIASEKPENTRKTILVSSPFVLAYNICVFSIGGIINEILVDVFTVVTIVKEHRNKKASTI